MEPSNLKTYFNDYIKEYLPYRDNKLVNKLVDFLSERYFTDAYEEVPVEFIQLFEQGEIIESIYDQILIQLGVPQLVVDSLRIKDKEVFLKAINDFMRYKGSIEFFKKVNTGFSDEFDIYELYADWNEYEGRWVLKPYLIIKGTRFNKIDSVLDYDEVYDQVPTLLISSTQLTSLKDAGNITLPIKTNLVMLDYNMTYHVSIMTPLIISTLLKEHGGDRIPIYFNDAEFLLELKELYFNWYYIMTYYYNTEFVSFNPTRLLYFSEYINPYTLEDLEEIQYKLDKIDYAVDAVKFCDEHLTPYFQTIYQSGKTTKEDMRKYVLGISPNFLNYFENTIDGLSGDNLSRTVNDIVERMYDSLILYERSITDPLYKKYFNIFMLSLPHIILKPESTVSYLIMYNMKPYHVEFVTRYQNSIVCEDPLDHANPFDEHRFLIELLKTDFISKMDDEYFFGLTTYKEEWMAIQSIPFYYFHLDSFEDHITKIYDDFNNKFKLYLTNVNEIAWQAIVNFHHAHDEYKNINDLGLFLLSFNETISTATLQDLTEDLAVKFPALNYMVPNEETIFDWQKSKNTSLQIVSKYMYLHEFYKILSLNLTPEIDLVFKYLAVSAIYVEDNYSYLPMHRFNIPVNISMNAQISQDINNTDTNMAISDTFEVYKNYGGV